MNQITTRDRPLLKANLALARRLWTGQIRGEQKRALDALFQMFRLSVAAGDLQLLEGRWYVTHSGLLRLACRKKCVGIKTALQKPISDPVGNRWVFKAIVYTAPASRGFVGYGDADPSNVSPLVRGAEMRVAETRAVNRALRKAYGIGLCSVEELGSFSSPAKSFAASPQPSGSHGANGSNNGQPRLRDQLCLLIRQYNLDPTLVKAYAVDFCGTQTLKEASRDLVESFVSQLAAAAKSDRDGLVCKLNSYVQPVEGKP
jgi:hypothetical protein